MSEIKITEEQYIDIMNDLYIQKAKVELEALELRKELAEKELRFQEVVETNHQLEHELRIRNADAYLTETQKEFTLDAEIRALERKYWLAKLAELEVVE